MSQIKVKAALRRTLLKTLYVLPPAALYGLLHVRLPSTLPELWFGLSIGAALTYIAVYAFKGDRLSLRLFIPALGLLMAGVAQYTGQRWLHMVYLPYVLAASLFFDLAASSIAVISVPLFELGHILSEPVGARINEEFTVIGLSALIFGTVSAFRFFKDREIERLGGRRLDYRYGESHVWEGLEKETDPEIRSILRNVMFMLRPDSASLFLFKDDELGLRASTGPGVELLQGGLIHDAYDEGRTMFSNRLKKISPGYRRPGSVSSVVASIVKDGPQRLGVLSMDCGRKDAFRDGDVKVLDLFAEQISFVMGRKRVHDETAKNLLALETLKGATARLITTLDMEALAGLAIAGAREIAPLDAAFFVKEEKGFRLAGSHGIDRSGAEHVSLDGTLAGSALGGGLPEYIRDTSGYRGPVLPFGGRAASALILPLRYEEETLGLMVLTSPDTDSVTAGEHNQIRIFSTQVAISLKNALLHAEIKRQAVTDALTGLYNRRRFSEIVEGEIERTLRNGWPLSLLLIDIDFFKKINDTYGHPAGDVVLKEVAGLIKKSLRDIDPVARLGGEEFGAVLINTDTEVAALTADRLRRAVERTVISAGESRISLTLSMGMASCPGDAVQMAELMEKADAALYHAKKTGRNKVVTQRLLA